MLKFGTPNSICWLKPTFPINIRHCSGLSVALVIIDHQENIHLVPDPITPWGYELYDIFTRGNSEDGPNFTLKFGTLGFCGPEDTYTISALRKVFHMLKNAKTIKNVS